MDVLSAAAAYISYKIMYLRTMYKLQNTDAVSHRSVTQRYADIYDIALLSEQV